MSIYAGSGRKVRREQSKCGTARRPRTARAAALQGSGQPSGWSVRTGCRGKTVKFKVLLDGNSMAVRPAAIVKAPLPFHSAVAGMAANAHVRRNPHRGKKQRADVPSAGPAAAALPDGRKIPQKIFCTVLTGDKICAIMISQPKSTDPLTETGNLSRGGSNHSEPPCHFADRLGSISPLRSVLPFCIPPRAASAARPNAPYSRPREKEETQ